RAPSTIGARHGGSAARTRAVDDPRRRRQTTRRRVVATFPLPRAARAALANASVRVYRGPRPLPRRRLLALVRAADGLLCQLTERVDAEVLAAAPRLRAVANCAVGYDNVDLAAAERHGIVVTNTPDV